MGEMVRLDLPEPGEALDWFPDDGPVGLPGTLTETAYTLPDNLTLGQWLQVGETLQRMERSVQWWLGDWWRYGERFGDLSLQATRDMVKDATGHTYSTVTGAAWVAGKFDVCRRRQTLPFAHHAEVAALPEAEAEALLDEAEAKGMKRAQLRERVKERRQVIDMEAALAKPAPAPEWVPSNVRIEAADARRLPLDDGCIDLIVTSPPYGVGVAYAEGDVPPDEWEAFTRVWLAEALRVAREGGRLALNVPLDTFRGGERPTYAQAVGAAVEVGWRYRSTVIWMDDQLGKSVARGSVDSASSPYVYAGAEAIALFSNGPWKRPAPCPPDIEHREWLEWTNGIWRLTGETRAWEGHPAPFPAELVRRLVKLLSFPGDAVLDPFCGSGTTPLVASRLGREGLGFDVSEAYVRSALRRATVPGRQSA